MLPLYLVFEGSATDYRRDIPYLKEILGPDDGSAPHQYAYGIGVVPLLTRSAPFLRQLVNEAFDIAERENVPIMFHLDPMYGFLANTETRREDAPATKYWETPDMREWLAFPDGEKLPSLIPRPWFNWGSWVSPAPALPAFGSPSFLKFAIDQEWRGLAKPIGERLAHLRKVHRDYLFAGVNVGWETHFLDNRGVDAKNPPVAVWPVEARGVRMQPWEVNGQTGYASLHWMGWTPTKLAQEAERRKTTPNAAFDAQCFKAVHDYMEALAKTLVSAGVSPSQIYTHIVAISTVHPEATNNFLQPTWVAVNPYSVPGFTMDNRGAAVYNLPVLKSQIADAQPGQSHFACIESYLANYRDEPSFTQCLHETFDNGGVIKVLFGPFGKGTPFELDPKPRGATLAVLKWIRASK